MRERESGWTGYLQSYERILKKEVFVVDIGSIGSYRKINCGCFAICKR